MRNNDNNKLVAARNLIQHIRRCCIALIDGATKMPRRTTTYWFANISHDAKFWRYPIITAATLGDCATLDIKIDDTIQKQSGVYQLSAFLMAIEKPLKDILLDQPVTNAQVCITKEFNCKHYTNSRLSKLPAIFSPIKTQGLPGVSLFLHGSAADLTFTAFSDIDDLVILRRASWQNPTTLLQTATLLAQVARNYQRVDPFQHHGHWALTEFDLLWYDQGYIPLVILADAVRVIGEVQVDVRIHQDLSGFIRNAQNTVLAMTAKLDKAIQHSGLNAFALKALVGEIAIMPSYLLQARGEMPSKPEAIDRASELYSCKALEALDWATVVRNNFDSVLNSRRTKTIETMADLTYARRQDAEKLFKKYALWVSNRHSLGLNQQVMETIKVFTEESRALISELES